MFSRTSRLNHKPVVLRIFRVLHTVQFSRFVVVCSQQQLVYLITTRCVCQQLFSIFLKVLFVFNFPRIQRCIRFYHFSSFVSSTFQNFLFFFEAFCFFSDALSLKASIIIPKPFTKVNYFFSFFPISFSHRKIREYLLLLSPICPHSAPFPASKKEVFRQPSRAN